MERLRGFAALAALAIATVLVSGATTPLREETSTQRCPASQYQETNLAELKTLFDADQADRANPSAIDWAVVGKRDRERFDRTKQLVAGGRLHTAEDFYRAAFIFQHGHEPDSYLMAHSLAMIAMACGKQQASWLAAATLDRYLINTGQPQIYGTQYMSSKNGKLTQEPFNSAIISDSMREQLGVPTLAKQQERRRRIEAETKQGS